jgi:dihydrolipoamide dehydrogenase
LERIEMAQFDITIIGGGPGGYVAANRAAQLGARVALIEKDRLGGVCLNCGCIPTKALIRSVELLHWIEQAANFGIVVGKPTIDFAAMMARKRAVVDQLVSGVASLMKANRIEVFGGIGRLLRPSLVQVTLPNAAPIELESKSIIIASGSVAAKPPVPGMNLPGVLTSDEMLELTEIPSSLAIVGAGVIGIEFANIFRALGTQVTMIEMLPTILLPVDEELSRRYGQLLKQQGIEVYLNSPVREIANKGGKLGVKFDSAQGVQEIEAEKVLVATGRVPYTEGLGLESVGVRVEKRAVVVNDHLATNVPGIYAIGDVTAKVMLAHVASRQGEVAVENALGRPKAMDYQIVPNCVYSMPEIAGVGLTEQECKPQGIAYKVSKFPFTASGRALTMGETAGLVKMICDQDGYLIGLHILGPQATDLIAEGGLALALGATAREIAETIHAHPTLPESIMEAAKGQLEGAIHAAPPTIRSSG